AAGDLRRVADAAQPQAPHVGLVDDDGAGLRQARPQLRRQLVHDAERVVAEVRADHHAQLGPAVALRPVGEALQVRLALRDVGLQRGLAAGEHGEAARALARWPLALDRIGKRVRRRVLAAERAVSADEIRVAEFAHGARTVLFVAGPQIAAGEAAEHRGTPGV